MAEFHLNWCPIETPLVFMFPVISKFIMRAYFLLFQKEAAASPSAHSLPVQLRLSFCGTGTHSASGLLEYADLQEILNSHKT